MKKSMALLGVAGLLLALIGCANDSSVPDLTPISNAISQTYGIFQNPFMAPNPNSNMHCDSYLSDSYVTAGPTTASKYNVRQFDSVQFIDPITGLPRTVFMGECASPCFDRQGNILTYSAGTGIPNTNTTVTRSVMALDPITFQVVAYTEYQKTGILDPNDFGGAGYFYVDNQDRLVVGTPDGHIQVLGRRTSNLSTTDQYFAVRDINVTGTGGPVTVKPAVLTSTNTTEPKLYALMPDKAGNIWFTVGQGIVGYITPTDQLLWLDLNDPTGSGTPTPQPDLKYEEIANSQPMDEGDNNGLTGMYVATTYKQYRLQAGATGPEIVWQIAYDHGPQKKPGQVSWGTGTSPTMFKMGGRRFVTMADNALNMHINVYRAEAQLNAGETRLFAQIAPFGTNATISDENSLIVAPAADGSYCDIFCENNWGYSDSSSVNGTNTTVPGFARVRVTPDSNIVVGSVNYNISVPTLVSKISIPSQTVYTYNKTATGWFFTGLDAQDLNHVRFTVQVGPGTLPYDNHYAGLSMSPNDHNTFFIGTILGITRVTLVP